MSETTTTAATLTAEQVANILTKPLEAKSVMLANGPRIFDTTGPLRVPTAPPDGSDALPFTGESALIPEKDPAFGEVSLLPSTMKSVKVITRYSNELARQSVVSLEAALRDRLVADVAAKLDKQFFSNAGDGTAEPMGLFKVSGIAGNVPGTGGKLTVADVLSAQAIALEHDNDPASLRLFVNAKTYSALVAEKAAADGRYMLQPDPTQPGVGRIFGMPVVLTNHIPTAAVGGVLVDMARVAVARDLAPSVTVLTERYADYDEQAIRVVARYDWKPLDPKAIVTLGTVAAPTIAAPVT